MDASTNRLPFNRNHFLLLGAIICLLIPTGALAQRWEKAMELAESYKRQKQYQQVKEAYQQAIQAASDRQDLQRYLMSVQALTQFLESRGWYGSTIPLYEQHLALARRAGGESDSLYAKALSNLAHAQRHAGHLLEALPMYRQSLSIRERVARRASTPRTVELLATGMHNLSGILAELGQYKEALPLAEKALELTKQSSGTENEDYANTLRMLGLHQQEMGDFSRALQSMQNALSIESKVSGEHSCDYALNLALLAGLLSRTGGTDEALERANNALSILTPITDTDHPDYATVLATLAEIKTRNGALSEAIPLLEQALKIQQTTLSREHPDYATTLNDLGGIYLQLGRYDVAAIYFRQALDIRAKVRGKKHTDYGTSLTGLGLVANRTNRPDTAVKYLVEAAQIFANTFGQVHPSYAQVITNLGFIYSSQNQLTEAEQLYKQAITVFQSSPVTDTRYYGAVLLNLTSLYLKKRDFVQASATQQTAMAMARQAKDERFIAQCYQNEALLQTGRGSFGPAVQANQMAIDHFKHFFDDVSFGASTPDRERALVGLEDAVAFGHSLVALLPTDTVRQKSFSAQLSLSNALLDQSRQFFRSLENSPDSTIRRMSREWAGLKKQLIQQQVLLKDKPQQQLALELKAEALERALMVSFPALKRARQPVGMAEVKRALNPREAAVEFVRFRPYKGYLSDSVLYAAYIIRPEWNAPRFIVLGDESTLQGLFTYQQKASEQLYQLRSPATDSLVKFVWSPLEAHLTGITQVYYAPAGILHKLAFDALPDRKGIRLGERTDFVLRRVLSVRQLPLRPSKLSAKPSLFLLGGVDYHTYRQQKNQRSLSTAGPDLRPTIESLPGTRAEVLAVDSLFAGAGKVSLLLDKRAQEEAVKNLSGQAPDVIMLATHGFYYNDPTQQRMRRNILEMSGNNPFFQSSENPLNRSGLLLAGAEDYFLRDSIALVGQEDGILTAYELEDLNLSATQLGVLSACESGLGDARGAEGIYGLQRALKLAGVQQMLISLWKVPDRATYQLIKTFFRHYKAGLPAHQALLLSQRQLRAQTRYKSAYFWAGFILVE